MVINFAQVAFLFLSRLSVSLMWTLHGVTSEAGALPVLLILRVAIPVVRSMSYECAPRAVGCEDAFMGGLSALQTSKLAFCIHLAGSAESSALCECDQRISGLGRCQLATYPTDRPNHVSM